MRLQSYLKESIDVTPEEIIETLYSECEPFLKILAKNNASRRFLYRGSNTYHGDIKSVTPRKNRKPRDTPPELHNTLDRLFKNKFGWKVRSEGVFAAPGAYFADFSGEYGYEHLFFPAGRFRYVWSPHVQDIYVRMDEGHIIEYFKYRDTYLFNKWAEYKSAEIKKGNKSYKDLGEWKEESQNEIEEEILKEIESIVELYTNKGLNKAIRSGHEIAFSCKKYYMVSLDHQEDIEELLLELY